MRKLLILLILIYGELHALDRDSTLKMYQGIFSALSFKKPIFIYTNDKEYRDVFKYSEQIILTNTPEKSDIVLMTQESELKSMLTTYSTSNGNSQMPILFVTKYQLLKFSEDVVGAFYWKKGRSQLLFIKKRLERHNIKLPREYQNFMVDAL